MTRLGSAQAIVEASSAVFSASLLVQLLQNTKIDDAGLSLLDETAMTEASLNAAKSFVAELEGSGEIAVEPDGQEQCQKVVAFDDVAKLTGLIDEISTLQQDRAAIQKKAKQLKQQRDELICVLMRVSDHYDAAKSSGYTPDAMAVFTKAMDIELGASKELLDLKAKKMGGTSGAAGALSRNMAK